MIYFFCISKLPLFTGVTVVLLEFVIVDGGSPGINSKSPVTLAVFIMLLEGGTAIIFTSNVINTLSPTARLGNAKPINGSKPTCGIPFICTLPRTNSKLGDGTSLN